jgi:hypothetical protein
LGLAPALVAAAVEPLLPLLLLLLLLENDTGDDAVYVI